MSSSTWGWPPLWPPPSWCWASERPYWRRLVLPILPTTWLPVGTRWPTRRTCGDLEIIFEFDNNRSSVKVFAWKFWRKLLHHRCEARRNVLRDYCDLGLGGWGCAGAAGSAHTCKFMIFYHECYVIYILNFRIRRRKMVWPPLESRSRTPPQTRRGRSAPSAIELEKACSCAL